MTSHVAETVQQALTKLSDARGEIVLDFSGVRLVDAQGLHELENLAAKAHAKSVKVVLERVGTDVYKVLKLMKIEGQFQYL
jgi:anti-anti-sigma regulatory factor